MKRNGTIPYLNDCEPPIRTPQISPIVNLTGTPRHVGKPCAYYWSTGWLAVAFLAGAFCMTIVALVIFQP